MKTPVSKIAALLLSILSCFFGTQLAFAQCVTPPSGLASWWRAESNSLDATGANQGVVQSNVTYVSGEVSNAFNFNGRGAAVLLGDASSLQLQDFTIEGWIKRASTNQASSDGGGTNGMLFSYGTGGYGFGMESNGTLFLTQVDYSQVPAGSVTDDTTWHHVACVSSNGTVIIYVDSVPHTASTLDAVGYYFATQAAVGARGDNNQECSFLGAIDELSVYSRALAASEISSIYHAGTNGKCVPSPNWVPCDTAPSNMVAWWKGESNTCDEIPNPGNIQGEVYYAPGEVGVGFLMTNIYSGIVVPNSAELQFPTTNPVGFTIESWIRLMSTSNVSLDTSAGSGSNALIFGYGQHGYGFGLHPGGQLFLTHVGVSETEGPTVQTTNFTHVAVTYTNSPTNYLIGTATFYINGAPTNTNYFFGNLMYDTQPSIGARGDTLQCSFNGIIDELSIYNRALTTTEITNIYLAGAAGKGDSPPTNLVAWWKGENDTFDSAWEQGTPEGALGYGQGEVGASFAFATSNSAVLVGNPAALQLQNFTLEGWIKRSSSGFVSWPSSSDGEFFSYGTGGYGWGIHSSGTTFLTQVGNGETNGPSITDTSWHHLAVTKSNSTVVFYNNGAPVNTNTYNPVLTFTGSSGIFWCFFIGPHAVRTLPARLFAWAGRVRYAWRPAATRTVVRKAAAAARQPMRIDGAMSRIPL